MTTTATTTGQRLLADHIADFNHGVLTGDWSRMVGRLTDGAEMVFVGVPVGPFHGRDAIARAYASQPPDDTMTSLDVAETADEIVAGYAWDRRPSVRSGELRLRQRDGLIDRLVVTFTGEAA